MFRKGKIYSSNDCKNGKIENSNVWKRQNLECQCLEKGKIENSNVLKKAKFIIAMFGKRQN